MAPATEQHAGIPGLRIGPLDPDKTESFGQVSATHNARRLIRLHSQMHPPELRLALSKKLDEPRTAAVLDHLDEVHEYLSGLSLENGDPVLPEGSVLEGANVRGEPGRPQVLTFTYRVPSGRSAKWFVPYDGEKLPDAHALGSELSRIARARDRGLVAWDDPNERGTHAQILERENRGLRRESQALREQLEGRGAAKAGEPVPETEGDSRPDLQIVDENERLGRETQELRARVAQLEGALNALPGGVDALSRSESPPPGDDVASADPPLEDYDDLNADAVAKILKDEDTSDETREQILAYERTHANRATVVKAGERALDKSE